MRFVRRDGERGKYFAEEQPGAVLAGDEIGVLALPADAGVLRQRLFHQRRGINEHLHRGAAFLRQPVG